MQVRTTLYLFYRASPFDTGLCLHNTNELPNITFWDGDKSRRLVNDMFEWITGIKNWPNLKIEQAYTHEYDNIVDISYLVILEGRQKLQSDYKWVKLSDLASVGFVGEKMERLMEVFSRRF